MTPALWIPPAARPKTLRCRVPGCTSAPFPEEQQEQFRRHVKACAKRNFGDIEAALAQREETYFVRSADPEKYAHIRAGGS